MNISVLSSGGFDKYQYLTGEELIAKLERKPDLNIFHYARFLLQDLRNKKKKKKKKIKNRIFKKVKKY